PRDVRFGGEVDDDVGSLDEALGQRGIPHVAIPELDAAAGAIEIDRQVVDAARVGEEVEHQNLVTRIRRVEMMDEIAADEAGAARDENGLHAMLRWSRDAS